ncbi:uncharacterized protein LOC106151517 isoform X1 [Lingula anatina]|uniref:Uncharacterized protein LOC106151517 isoform X1 n=1 Tax=Lingula anatina TaxID=7574 RepID=A0A1S3H2V1_LINAN|nr:uncharacterized protein LOC106151517 isoform X1 [Lingula anatina]|eukprot:XP_013380272.1 uncharacterized protein LOC106151517 isoform X1 [Lingula anatina]
MCTDKPCAFLRTGKYSTQLLTRITVHVHFISNTSRGRGLFFGQLGQVASAYCQHNGTPCNWVHEVKFPIRFDFTPTIFASLAGIDARSDRNLRLQALVSKVTQAGFTLTFSSWADTHVYHAMATWIACDEQQITDKESLVG